MDEVRSTNRARRRARLIKLGGVTAGVAAAALALSACSSSSNSSSSGGTGGASGGSGKKVGVSLILKTLTNPYFVSMEKDAKTAASQEQRQPHRGGGQDGRRHPDPDRRDRQRDLPG